MIAACTAAPSAVILMFPTTPRAPEGFTWSDRMALQDWSRRAAAFGYGRMLIEPGCPGDGPDRAAYALIYRRNDPWSRWGLSRSPAGIMLWCSLTGTDHGIFRTMDAALASLTEHARACQDLTRPGLPSRPRQTMARCTPAG